MGTPAVFATHLPCATYYSLVGKDCEFEKELTLINREISSVEQVLASKRDKQINPVDGKKLSRLVRQLLENYWQQSLNSREYGWDAVKKMTYLSNRCLQLIPNYRLMLECQKDTKTSLEQHAQICDIENNPDFAQRMRELSRHIYLPDQGKK